MQPMTQHTPIATQVTRISAYGLIVREGRILLCRNSSMVRDAVGQWTLPGGGIEFGEDPVDAVVREVFEETGFHVSGTELVAIDSRTVSDYEPLLHAIRIIYRVEVQSGEMTHELDGTTDLCAWLTPEEARELPLVGLAAHGVALALPAPDSASSARSR